MVYVKCDFSRRLRETAKGCRQKRRCHLGGTPYFFTMLRDHPSPFVSFPLHTTYRLGSKRSRNTQWMRRHSSLRTTYGFRVRNKKLTFLNLFIFYLHARSAWEGEKRLLKLRGNPCTPTHTLPSLYLLFKPIHFFIIYRVSIRVHEACNLVVPLFFAFPLGGPTTKGGGPTRAKRAYFVFISFFCRSYYREGDEPLCFRRVQGTNIPLFRENLERRERQLQ